MVMTSAKKGQAAKLKTKKWLEAQGYLVAYLERVYWIATPKGRFAVKRDQLASDLLAIKHATNAVVFAQVKTGRTGNFPEAARKFHEFVFPDCTERWIIAWAPRTRLPRIIRCA